MTTRATPTLVSGGHLFAQISAGFAHTCAADTRGAGYCWGSNTDATLGDGSRTDRHAPTAAKGGLSIEVVDAGGHHSCALAKTGLAYCWGANQYGQLGDGTTVSRTTPSAVAGGLTFAHRTLTIIAALALGLVGAAVVSDTRSAGALPRTRS